MPLPRPDAHSPRRALTLTRSPLGDERHHPGGQAVDGRAEDRAFKGPDVVRFLKHALRQIPGKLLITFWDGSPIHRAKVRKGVSLADGAAGEAIGCSSNSCLAGAAPELNPDEGIWKHLKYVELKNVCCPNLLELRVELRKAKERLRHKRDVILGCIRQPGFEV